MTKCMECLRLSKKRTNAYLDWSDTYQKKMGEIKKDEEYGPYCYRTYESEQYYLGRMWEEETRGVSESENDKAREKWEQGIKELEIKFKKEWDKLNERKAKLALFDDDAYPRRCHEHTWNNFCRNCGEIDGKMYYDDVCVECKCRRS